jgi:hypothetical protein
MKYIICGLIFGFIETAYFGWNLYPHSHAESICDIIAMSLVAIGYANISYDKGYYDGHMKADEESKS